MGIILERVGPARGPRSQIKYRAVGQDGPGIQTNVVLPYNRLIVDEGSTEEPIVDAAKVGDPCLIQFYNGEQRLILWTEALVSGPCLPPTGNPTPPIVDTTPVGGRPPIGGGDPVPVG